MSTVAQAKIFIVWGDPPASLGEIPPSMARAHGRCLHPASTKPKGVRNAYSVSLLDVTSGENLRVLVVSAHADDAENALGGTLVRLLEDECDVHYLALSICEDSVPPGFPRDILESECIQSTNKLGISSDSLTVRRLPVRRFPEHRQEILDEFIALRGRLEPEVVFSPSTADVHQDHATVSAEVIRAFRRSSSIFGYDFPWNVLYTAQLNLFFELDERHLRRKIDALRLYKSQLAKENNCLTEEYVRSLAIERGNRVGVRYAEAFEVIREVRRTFQ